MSAASRNPKFVLKNIPIHQIRVGDNPRLLDEAHVRTLQPSIQAIGQIVPLLVQAAGDEFELIDGQHRLQAMKNIGFSEVSCLILESPIEKGLMLSIQGALGTSQKKLSPIEVEEIVANILSLSPDANRQSTEKKLGVSKSSKSKLMAIQTGLCEQLRPKFVRSEIPVTVAYLLARIKGNADKQVELHEKFSQGLLKRDSLADAVTDFLDSQGKAKDKKRKKCRLECAIGKLILNDDAPAVKKMLQTLQTALDDAFKQGLGVQEAIKLFLQRWKD